MQITVCKRKKGQDILRRLETLRRIKIENKNSLMIKKRQQKKEELKKIEEKYKTKEIRNVQMKIRKTPLFCKDKKEN